MSAPPSDYGWRPYSVCEPCDAKYYEDIDFLHIGELSRACANGMFVRGSSCSYTEPCVNNRERPLMSQGDVNWHAQQAKFAPHQSTPRQEYICEMEQRLVEHYQEKIEKDTPLSLPATLKEHGVPVLDVSSNGRCLVVRVVTYKSAKDVTHTYAFIIENNTEDDMEVFLSVNNSREVALDFTDDDDPNLRTLVLARDVKDPQKLVKLRDEISTELHTGEIAIVFFAFAMVNRITFRQNGMETTPLFELRGPEPQEE